MDIDAEQLLHSPPQKETGPFRSYTVKKKKLVCIKAPRTKQLMRIRDGVMTYLYLTSVFFTSLERGAQREKSQREGAGEGKSEAAREGVKQTL